MTKYIPETFTSNTFMEEVNDIIANANDSAFEKYMPQAEEEEQVIKLTKSTITQFVIACADVKKAGGHNKIAHQYKVPKVIVKQVEKAIVEEWIRRNTPVEPEV